MKLFNLIICSILIVGMANADGTIKNLKDFEYRQDGKPWKCTVYDAQTGKLKGVVYYAGDGTISKMERFDGDGRRVEAALYDSKGKLRLGPDDWAAMRWWYHNSVLRLQVSYDAWGKPIAKLYFSEGGKLLGRYYRDDEKVNPYVNAAMYKMLGGNNIAYYDPLESYHETTQLLE